MSYKVTIKKLLSLIMAVLIVLSMLVIQVGAIREEESHEQIKSINSSTASPLWDNVNTSNLALTFSNKKIYAKINMTGIKGTKYKNGTVIISKYNGSKYVPVKKWTGLSSTTNVFLFSNSELSAVSGVKYKLSITITAYTSSKSEVISLNKIATCP